MAEYLAAGPTRRAELERRWLSEDPIAYEQVARRLNLLGDFGLGSDAGELPSTIGDYTIVGRIGWGGMGVVYAALEPGSEREVALKRLPFERRVLPEARKRFEREIEAVQRLRHPGIVPVLAVGEDGEGPFFTMERVHGVNLAELLRLHAGADPRRLSATDFQVSVANAASGGHGAESEFPALDGSWTDLVLRLVRQVAETLEHAHGRGVVHRDIKPENILCTPAGRALLIDFGLADTGDSVALTRSGAMVGSLPYMAPEQVRAERAMIGPKSDIYSLGVVLYELLTLVEAFPRGNRVRLLEAVTNGDVAPPRKLRQDLPARIETVCLAAMAHDPADRYATAGDFARDLGALIQGRSIEARRLGPWTRTRSWLNGRPRLGAALKAGAGVALLSVGLIGWREVEARGDLQREQIEARARVQAQKESSQALLEAQRLRGEAELEAERLRADRNFERSEWAAVAAVDMLAALDPSLSSAQGRSEVLLEATAKLRVSLRDYPDNLAFALYAVASVQGNLGELARAEGLLREAIGLYDQAGFVRGAARSHAALGALLVLCERFEEAESALQEARALSQGVFEAHEHDPGRIECTWAALRSARSEFVLAETHARQALAYYCRDTSGSNDAWYRKAHEELGQALFGQRRLDAAARAFRVAEEFWLRGRDSSLLDGAGELSEYTAEAVHLGRLAAHRARLSRARMERELELAQWRRSVELLEQGYPKGHPTLFASLQGLGEALVAFDDPEGRLHIERALVGYASYLAPDSATFVRARGTPRAPKPSGWSW